ncbi:hypothetical protein BGZ95_004167, partial [Linnemannia exigua]
MPEYNSTLVLDCIATDPQSTTIYGISKVWRKTIKSVMLLKSIANPSHISEKMWTVVSETIDAPLSYWGDENDSRPFNSIDCAVSSKGAFSAFFRNGQFLTPGSGVTVPIGVRYDPESQAWSSIKTSPYYGWTSDFWPHKSFYVNKDGVERAVHVLTDSRGTVIRFGVVNETKNVLQLASVWKKDGERGYTPGDQSDSMAWVILQQMDFYPVPGLLDWRTVIDNQKMMYVNGRLYIINYQGKNEIIDSYPFTDAASPPPPKDQVFKGPDRFASLYLFSGTRGGSTYLGGIGRFDYKSDEYTTYTISNLNGVMQSGPTYTAPFYNYTTTESRNRTLKTHAVNENFLGVGGHLDGQDPFVIGLTSRGVYEFTINSTNIGNSIGVMDVLITAPEIFASPNPAFMERYNSKRKTSYPSSNKTSTEEVIFFFFGSMIGLLFLAAVIHRYRRKARVARGLNNNNNRGPLDARGRRIPQEFAMGTLTHRTGHASGASGRPIGTGTGPLTTATTTLHPSITNADIVAYENAVLNDAAFSSDPPPEFSPTPAEESNDSHPTTASASAAVAAADPLPPPPTYEDNGQAPEYSRHPQQTEVVIPISRA